MQQAISNKKLLGGAIRLEAITASKTKLFVTIAVSKPGWTARAWRLPAAGAAYL